MVEGAWRKWKPSWIGIEKTTASLSLLTEAQRRGVVVRPLSPDKSKGARAETAAALYEAGRIYHPRDDGGDWLDVWEDELLSFPVAAHDDTVDVTSYAAIELARNTVRGRKRSKDDVGDIDRHVRAFLDKRGRHRRHHPIIGVV
jgi:phage terminase large subunit-like protein